MNVKHKKRLVLGLVLGLGLSVFVILFSITFLTSRYKNDGSSVVTQTQSSISTITQQISLQTTTTTTSVKPTTMMMTTHNTTTKTTQENVVKNERIIDVPTTPELRKIVNKKHPLPADYNPGENPTAKQAFLKLKEAMQYQGFSVSDQYSGFRSYAHQKRIFEKYVETDGRKNAERYSARPGYSEHQLGLAFDFIDTSGQLLGEGIQDGATEWLAKNAHLYGFVVRYVAGKEHITGYMPETWHVRFIGNDAIAVYQSGLTLEEFYGVEGGDYLD